MWSACSAPGLKELITRAFRGKFRLGSSSSFGRKSQSSPHHACVTFWLMSTQDGEMADEEKLSRCKISTDNVYKTLKTHTKYAYIVRGRPTLKDFERFRNGSFRESYKISLYERTFLLKVLSLYSLVHYFQSIHNNNIFEERGAQIENIQNRMVSQKRLNEIINFNLSCDVALYSLYYSIKKSCYYWNYNSSLPTIVDKGKKMCCKSSLEHNE